MKKFMKSFFPKFLFLAIITIIVVTVVLNIGDFKSIVGVIKTSKPLWIFYICIAILLYIILNQISLYILTRAEYKQAKFWDVFLIGSTEYFFNGITPFSTGGQPFQAYAYKQIGVKVSDSTGILIMNYICYQAAIVILCILAIFVPYAYHTSLTENVSVFLIVFGIAINVFVLLMFIALAVSKTARKIMAKFVYWIAGWRIWKGKAKNMGPAFEKYCIDAQETFKKIFLHKVRFSFAFIIKFIATVIYFVIPFLVFRAINVKLDYVDIPLIICLTTFAIAMSCFIPTPGAAGGIEFAFNALFLGMVTVKMGEGADYESIATAGMLIWRFATYYLLMIISMILYFVFTFKHKTPIGNVADEIHKDVKEIVGDIESVPPVTEKTAVTEAVPEEEKPAETLGEKTE